FACPRWPLAVTAIERLGWPVAVVINILFDEFIGALFDQYGALGELTDQVLGHTSQFHRHSRIRNILGYGGVVRGSFHKIANHCMVWVTIGYRLWKCVDLIVQMVK